MENLLETSIVDTWIKEIETLNCIEASLLKSIAYVAGTLTSEEVRQSSLVVVIDLLSQKIKCKEYEPRVTQRHPRNEEH